MCNTVATFRYSLSVLKIYNTRYVHYRFSVLTVLAMNIGTAYVVLSLKKERESRLFQRIIIKK